MGVKQCPLSRAFPHSLSVFKVKNTILAFLRQIPGSNLILEMLEREVGIREDIFPT